MRRSKAVAGVAILALSLSGCAAMQERRWSWCAVGGGLLGAAVGGTAAGMLVSEYEGGDGGTDSETAGAAAAGGVGGGILGTILGHLICDPVETPPPPPPPPPPVAKPAPPAPGTKITEIKGPHFDFNKSTIKPEGQRRLDDVVRLMRDNPTMKVEAVGHTDSVGSDAYNLKLGERRARSVASYLTEQGVSSSRIDIRSEGKARPVASNATAEGRAENRRVEILAE
jgi:outer membrane protein OmpA-like peptidoglycan-associated protein